MADESKDIFGFRRQHANILADIAQADSTGISHSGGHRFRILECKTGAGGIAANSSGTVYYRKPTSSGWADTSIEYTAYNLHPTAAVGNSTIILIAPINGRWCVIAEMCA